MLSFVFLHGKIDAVILHFFVKEYILLAINLVMGQIHMLKISFIKLNQRWVKYQQDISLPQT